MLLEGFEKDERYKWYEEYEDENWNVVDGRKITLVDGQESVEQDSNSEYISFKIQRSYDGFDRKDMKIHILFRNKEGKVGTSDAVNVQYSEDLICFGWLLDEYATALHGKLEFQIVFSGSNSKGEDYEWSTEICDEKMILESLKSGASIGLTDNWMKKIENMEATVAGFEEEYVKKKDLTQAMVPIATDESLGVVKGGDNVNIVTDGTMRINQTGIERITNEEIDTICV